MYPFSAVPGAGTYPTILWQWQSTLGLQSLRTSGPVFSWLLGHMAEGSAWGQRVCLRWSQLFVLVDLRKSSGPGYKRKASNGNEEQVLETSQNVGLSRSEESGLGWCRLWKWRYRGPFIDVGRSKLVSLKSQGCVSQGPAKMKKKFIQFIETQCKWLLTKPSTVLTFFTYCFSFNKNIYKAAWNAIKSLSFDV